MSGVGHAGGAGRGERKPIGRGGCKEEIRGETAKEGTGRDGERVGEESETREVKGRE